ncbi:Sugar transporter family protein [Sporothrix brasiliensis 5110]|uniref:Sugar transporter family protein n=1 Tax=Sporothrix brasiliensis 5110 TaxID=1398154 RepID=A0A0C2EWX9_9PEZI|nr:Sugar transporter family protein [Sporothrix brasiliensis 5110]KIH91084.1 Sugar transporter family protein [Sporothrix brasiliensis 5110]
MTDTKMDGTAVAATAIDTPIDTPVDTAAGHVLDANAPHDAHLPFREALRLHAKAVAWSAYVSIGVIMLAFDPQLLGNLYAMKQFTNDFGELSNGEPNLLAAAWQTGLSMGNPVGQVVGAIWAAYPMEWYGRKKTFATCVVLTAGLIFIQFFARSLNVLLVGELLGGIVLGMYVVIAPAYASEVCPTALRGHMTSFVNLCFVMGQLLGNGVTNGTSSLATHWAYSLPFAIQWVWIAILLPGLAFVPESPWWLVRRNDLDGARASLARLSAPQVDLDAALAFIVHTDRLELALELGSTYLDCFKRENWRQTEVSMGVYCTQVLSGIYLINYGTYFFEQAGLPDAEAFNMAVGFLAVGFVGTLLSWYAMVHVGRRTIYVCGLAVLAVLQFVIGILDCVPGRPSGAIWAESVLMIVWNGIYDLTVGPICFVLLSECSATRVRSKTIAVATMAQGVLGIVMTVAIPYMINPGEANMQGKLGFFYGGLATLCLVWAWLRVPETKGRSYEELDILFARNVPARQFKTYVIEPANSEVEK